VVVLVEVVVVATAACCVMCSGGGRPAVSQTKQKQFDLKGEEKGTHVHTTESVNCVRTIYV